jgi:2-iminobutanoate/2-iminopropanoate deaminase
MLQARLSTTALLLTTLLGGMSGCATPEPQDRIEYLGSLGSASGPFSTAVRAGDYLYISGQIGSKPAGTSSEAEANQTAARHAMEGIRQGLSAAGATFDDVFKCTVMLSDIRDWEAFNQVYLTYFKLGHLPARSAFGTSGLAKNAAFEVECAAYLPRPGHRPAPDR